MPSILKFVGAVLSALCLLASPVFAADVPVIGVATGDATRGPLVDYIQAMGTMSLRTPGYNMIAPDRAADLVDKVADKPRLPEAVSADTKKAVSQAEQAIADQDWLLARNTLAQALGGIEKAGGARIPLGEGERWMRVRLLLATSLVLDHAKKKTASEDNLKLAETALTPVIDLMPSFVPDSTDYDPELVTFYSSVQSKLRRTGTLTVQSPAKGADVYVNGVTVGQAPLAAYRLSEGKYEVQVGSPDKPSRIHIVELKAGKDVAIVVDPKFEFELTTEGYAIVEAGGQAADAISVQVGASMAIITHNRYALVFAVEGASPLRLYAAMVDSQTNVVLRDQVVEVNPGPVNTMALQALLIYVIEGRVTDTSWPWSRWAWLGGLVVTTGAGVGSGMLFIAASDKQREADKELNGSPGESSLQSAADQRTTFAWVTASLGAVALGLTIWFIVLDTTADKDSSAKAGDWNLFALPFFDERGATGGALAFQVVF